MNTCCGCHPMCPTITGGVSTALAFIAILPLTWLTIRGSGGSELKLSLYKLTDQSSSQSWGEYCDDFGSFADVRENCGHRDGAIAMAYLAFFAGLGSTIVSVMFVYFNMGVGFLRPLSGAAYIFAAAMALGAGISFALIRYSGQSITLGPGFWLSILATWIVFLVAGIIMFCTPSMEEHKQFIANLGANNNNQMVITTTTTTQQPAAVQYAQPVAAPQMMQVTVPNGVEPGQNFQVQTPSGQMMMVTCPPNVGPGQLIQVQC